MIAVVSEKLHLVPLDAQIGAEIRGVDLSRDLGPGLMRQIEEAYDRYSALVFRGQQLTPEQQIRFPAFFGPLEIHVLKSYLLSAHPQILVVSNINEEEDRFIGLPDVGQTSHTDTSYRENQAVDRCCTRWRFLMRRTAGRWATLCLRAPRRPTTACRRK